MSGNGSRGFTLIELLITLVVIGIISAIMMPALVNSLDKSRQKRTMADLRLLGGAIETYSVDHGHYPMGSDIGALNVLAPQYVDDLIAVDAWAHDLVYTGMMAVYTLGSTGKDGGNSLALTDGGGPTQDFDDDIIYSQGNFVQWPEGRQQ